MEIFYFYRLARLYNHKDSSTASQIGCAIYIGARMYEK